MNHEDSDFEKRLRKVLRETGQERMMERREQRADTNWYRGWLVAAVCVIALLIMALCVETSEPPKACGPDVVFEAKVAHAAEYIAQHNSKVDASQVARMIVTASREARLSPPADYRLLLALARYESTFRPGARGKRGERGLLQVHPVHFTPMRQAGLDPTSDYDCLLYGALIISWEQAKGRSLHAALRPWTVRSKAISEWRNI